MTDVEVGKEQKTKRKLPRSLKHALSTNGSVQCVLCVARLSAIGWMLLCVDYDVMLTALLAETTLPSVVQSALIDAFRF